MTTNEPLAPQMLDARIEGGWVHGTHPHQFIGCDFTRVKVYGHVSGAFVNCTFRNCPPAEGLHEGVNPFSGCVFIGDYVEIPISISNPPGMGLPIHGYAAAPRKED